MAGVDNLTKGDMGGVDNLALGSGTAVDNLAKSAGTAFDGLAQNFWTLANEDKTLDDAQEASLEVMNTDDFASDGGHARVIAKADGTEELIDYTGKNATTLEGVTCTSDSYDVKIGDRIETR